MFDSKNVKASHTVLVTERWALSFQFQLFGQY